MSLVKDYTTYHSRDKMKLSDKQLSNHAMANKKRGIIVKMEMRCGEESDTAKLCWAVYCFYDLYGIILKVV